MVDSITPAASTTPGPFDTAAIQIAQAQAQAAANHTNEIAFLEEIAKNNDDTNAQELTSTPESTAPKSFLTNGLPNVDPALDPTVDPSADPKTLALFSVFGANDTSASTKAQQLHDLGVLQRDAVLLEEAANENNHIALGTDASTVDLSPQAQDIVNGTAVAPTVESSLPTPTQLNQASTILQPLANEPLTPTLLQQIQTQLNAQQNPIQLSLNTINLSMNLIAGMQPSTSHLVENTATRVDRMAVAPVAAIDKVAIEDSAIR